MFVELGSGSQSLPLPHLCSRMSPSPSPDGLLLSGASSPFKQQGIMLPCLINSLEPSVHASYSTEVEEEPKLEPQSGEATGRELCLRPVKQLTSQRWLLLEAYTSTHIFV